MIKFKGTNEDGSIVILGLGITERNVALMRQGKPMRIPLDEMGYPGVTVALLLGQDEQALGMMLRANSLITEETQVHVDPKLYDEGTN